MAKRRVQADPMMRVSIRKMEELDRMQRDLDVERQRLLWELLAEAGGGQDDELSALERDIDTTYRKAHADDVRRIPPQTDV